MENGKAFVTATEKVMVLGQQHGKYSSKERPEEERLVNADHLAELEKIVLGKIRDAAKDDRLATSDSLPLLLYRLKEWGSEEEMKAWVEAQIATDDGLARFVEHFLSQPVSITMGDVVSKRKWRLDPQNMRPFLDPDQIAERVRALSQRTDWEARIQTALKQFVIEYDFSKQGKDPEDALDDMR